MVSTSPIHGWGVFATSKINKDEIFEECPFLELPISNGESSPLLIDYRFNYPSGSFTEKTKQVIALGYASLYNHSESPSAGWYTNQDKMCFCFYAKRDIEPGEEIFVWYGDSNYWNDGRSHVEIK
jgi:SET domain-containing protein